MNALRRVLGKGSVAARSALVVAFVAAVAVACTYGWAQGPAGREGNTVTGVVENLFTTCAARRSRWGGVGQRHSSIGRRTLASRWREPHRQGRPHSSRGRKRGNWPGGDRHFERSP